MGNLEGCAIADQSYHVRLGLGKLKFFSQVKPFDNDHY